MFLNWRSGSLGRRARFTTCPILGGGAHARDLQHIRRQPPHCPSCLLALTGGQAQAKIAQTAVHYQATPKDGKQCDGCNFFVAPNGCKLVDGEIAPTGWCALWAKKAPA
jgi:hypothetical protein